MGRQSYGSPRQVVPGQSPLRYGEKVQHIVRHEVRRR